MMPVWNKKCFIIFLFLRDISDCSVFANSFSYWDEYSENAIALDYLTRGKLHPEFMITHRFPLEEINKAFETAANKKETNAIKVMIIQE